MRHKQSLRLELCRMHDMDEVAGRNSIGPERFKTLPGNYEESLVGRESYLLNAEAIFRTDRLSFGQN
jgi:hypothetical protein